MNNILEVTGLHAGYDDLNVLNGIDLVVPRGEVVSVVGANGAGKSTLLRAISGVIRATAGSIVVDGIEVTGVAPHKMITHEIVMVPEGRKLFPNLTVEENLRLGAFYKGARAHAKDSLQEVFELFPRLTERRNQAAGSLSGGEQQMCAIGRGLMARPKILMLDEPSLGLAPIVVEQIFGLIKQLSESGLTILLVEQNVADALELSSQASVMEQGQVTLTGTGAELLDDPRLQAAYLGVI